MTMRDVGELEATIDVCRLGLAADRLDALVDTVTDFERDRATLDRRPIGSSDRARNCKDIVDGASDDVGAS